MSSNIPSNVGGYSLPDWAIKSIAGALVLFGFTVALFGYRLFRVTLFVVGFFVGSLAIGVPISEKVNSPSAPWIGVGVGAFIGLVLGSTASLFATLGTFLTGAGGGIAAGIALNSVVGWRIPLENKDVTMGLLAAGGGLAFGILALILRRPLIIIGTSILGSFAATFGIGSLIPPPNDLPNILDIATAISKDSNSVPSKVYIYIGAFAVASLLSVFFQSSFTAGKAPKKGEVDEWAALTEDELNGKFDTSRSSKGKKEKKDKKKDKKDKDSKKDKDAPASTSRSGSSGKMKASERLRAALLNDYSAGSPTSGGPPLPPVLPFNPANEFSSSSSASSPKIGKATAPSTSIWARSASGASSQASSAAPNPFRSSGNDFSSSANHNSNSNSLYPSIGDSYSSTDAAAVNIQIASYGGGAGSNGVGAASYTGDHDRGFYGMYGTSPAVNNYNHSGGIPDTNPWASASSAVPDWKAGSAPSGGSGAQPQGGAGGGGQKKKGWFGGR
jgi:Domain of unknown function (DUF4203)